MKKTTMKRSYIYRSSFSICLLILFEASYSFAQYNHDKDVPVSVNITRPADEITATESFDVISPLSWINVQASLRNKVVTIRWTTSTEVNVKSFEIERSSNGKDWSVVVSGVRAYALPGISHYEKTYTARKQKKMIYRIRQEDFDGTYNYSPVVRIVTAN
jgi:hypothetical protein